MFFQTFLLCCPLGALQVRALIQASEEDEIGKYVEGAMEKVMAASMITFKAINDARAT